MVTIVHKSAFVNKPWLLCVASVFFAVGCSQAPSEEQASELFKSAYADYIRTTLAAMGEVSSTGPAPAEVESRLASLRAIAQTHKIQSCRAVDLSEPYADVSAALCDLSYKDATGEVQKRTVRYVISPSSGAWAFVGVSNPSAK